MTAELEAEARRCMGETATIRETKRTVEARVGRKPNETKITVHVRKGDFVGARKALLHILRGLPTGMAQS
jgi:hypothetical protein